MLKQSICAGWLLISWHCPLHAMSQQRTVTSFRPTGATFLRIKDAAHRLRSFIVTVRLDVPFCDFDVVAIAVRHGIGDAAALDVAMNAVCLDDAIPLAYLAREERKFLLRVVGHIARAEGDEKWLVYCDLLYSMILDLCCCSDEVRALQLALRKKVVGNTLDNAFLEKYCRALHRSIDAIESLVPAKIASDGVLGATSWHEQGNCWNSPEAFTQRVAPRAEITRDDASESHALLDVHKETNRLVLRDSQGENDLSGARSASNCLRSCALL